MFVAAAVAIVVGFEVVGRRMDWGHVRVGIVENGCVLLLRRGGREERIPELEEI